MENCITRQRKLLHINTKKLQRYEKRIEKSPSEMKTKTSTGLESTGPHEQRRSKTDI